MAFTTCSVTTGIIAGLDDLPNDVGGLTAAQLKAKFDEGWESFLAWFNATHIVEADAHLADETMHLSVMTTQGDLVYQGASTPTRLAKGTAGQVLKMNAGATAPEWGSIGVACSVYNSYSQSLADDTDTALAMNSENFDTDSMHNNSTNNTRITFNTAGKYLIIGKVMFDDTSATGYRQVKIRLNGTTNISSYTVAGSAVFSPTVITIAEKDFSVGDYVELVCKQTSGSALNALASLGMPAFYAERVIE